MNFVCLLFSSERDADEIAAILDESDADISSDDDIFENDDENTSVLHLGMPAIDNEEVGAVDLAASESDDSDDDSIPLAEIQV